MVEQLTLNQLVAGSSPSCPIFTCRSSCKPLGFTQPIDYRFSSGLYTAAEANSTGDGNNLNIETDRPSVTDGAKVTANTLGAGDAGNIDIRLSDLAKSISVDRDRLDLPARQVDVTEAQAWKINRHGKIELVAIAPETNSLLTSPKIPSACCLLHRSSDRNFRR
jgi:hypothetical protein